MRGSTAPTRGHRRRVRGAVEPPALVVQTPSPAASSAGGSGESSDDDSAVSWRLEYGRLSIMKRDIESNPAFFEQGCAAASSAGAGGPSDTYKSFNAESQSLDRDILLFWKRNIESRLALLEQWHLATFGQVISAPVGCRTKRLRAEVAGKGKGGVRADATDGEGMVVDEAANDVRSEEWAGIFPE